MNVIFTKIRRKDLEEIIRKEGGNVTETMSRKCTHLVMKGGVAKVSSKEKTAKEYGMTIWTVEELESFLGYVKPE
jgi:NAD-dependent DNA ligase